MSRPASVTEYLENRAVKGRYYFTLKEISEELSIQQSSLSVSLSRLTKKKKIQMIRKGFGIITGLTRGTLHPSYFIDAMMKHLETRYYVGLLNAAAYRGASHQAVMNYTIVAEKITKPVLLEGLTIEFVTKNNFDEIEELDWVAGHGGYYFISTSELTVLDLIRFQKKSGHLNNIATIYDDLFDVVDLKKLEAICSKSCTSTTDLQRLGYILDQVLNRSEAAEFVYRALKKRRFKRTLLSIFTNRQQDVNSKFPVNEKWRICENDVVEPD
jgi:predicted transcriptional regulator of viral defense system